MQLKSDLFKTEPLKGFFSQYFSIKTKKEVTFPVPLATAQSRLMIAFSEPIVVPTGFLFYRNKYKGSVVNNELDIQFSIRGRLRGNYNMHATIMPDKNSSRMEMIVKESFSPFSFLPLLIIAYFLLMQSAAGIIVFLIFICIGSFIQTTWRRRQATENVAELINKIIANQSYQNS